MFEKQLAAVYAALLATEAVTGPVPVTVWTTYPIAGYAWDWIAKPPSEMVQVLTLAKWGAYLQQRSTPSTHPLWAELQEVLGPVIYVDEKSTVPFSREEMEASPFHERQTPIPSDALWRQTLCQDL